jgi:hypothetical protein
VRLDTPGRHGLGEIGGAAPLDLQRVERDAELGPERKRLCRRQPAGAAENPGQRKPPGLGRDRQQQIGRAVQPGEQKYAEVRRAAGDLWPGMLTLRSLNMRLREWQQLARVSPKISLRSSSDMLRMRSGKKVWARK